MKNLKSILLLAALMGIFEKIDAQKNKITSVQLSLASTEIVHNTNKVYLRVDATSSNGKKKYKDAKTSQGNIAWSKFNVTVNNYADFKGGVVRLEKALMLPSSPMVRVVISPKDNPSVSDTLEFKVPQIASILVDTINGQYLVGTKINLAIKVKLKFDYGEVVPFSWLDDANKSKLLVNSTSLANEIFFVPKFTDNYSDSASFVITVNGNPNVTKTVKVAYDFKKDVYLEAKGMKGINGKNGTGANPSSSSGINGQNGNPGENGQKGVNGINYRVYLSVIEPKPSIKMLKIKTINEFNQEEIFYVNPEYAKLSLNVSGGEGGNGGEGANGTDGSSSANYSDVGYGGDGGKGGDGGAGGKGGDVTIYVKKSDEKYLSNINVINYGGSGGSGGKGGAKGRAGSGQTNTRGQTLSIGLGLKNGSKGSDGNAGASGSNGVVSIVYPKCEG
jgi:hypothetical protein